MVHYHEGIPQEGQLILGLVYHAAFQHSLETALEEAGIEIQPIGYVSKDEEEPTT